MPCLQKARGITTPTTNAAGKCLARVNSGLWQVAGLIQAKTGELEKVAEYKVEMICIAAAIKHVVETLLSVHPCKEPAYEICKILTIADF